MILRNIMLPIQTLMTLTLHRFKFITDELFKKKEKSPMYYYDLAAESKF